MTHSTKYNVLFLCTGASCRSQMARGFAQARWGDRMEAYCAGTKPRGVNPLAVRVMAEAGVDISGSPSLHVDALSHIPFDLVVTVCGGAAEGCPVFHGSAKVTHRPFDDPPQLARGAKTEEEALAHYRRVRDEIGVFIEMLPHLLNP
ncbi:MAG: arsenate reductase ArsC [Nitrospinae bacterium]|nr:arsenate reductase ArsC [Nitrospinota bacterium]